LGKGRGGERDGGGFEKEGGQEGIGPPIRHPDPMAGWGRGREGVTSGRGNRSIPVLPHFEPW